MKGKIDLISIWTRNLKNRKYIFDPHTNECAILPEMVLLPMLVKWIYEQNAPNGIKISKIYHRKFKIYPKQVFD